MACGWNLWVWLECIGGVVVGVAVWRYVYNLYRYPHNNYYLSLLHLY